MSSTCCWDIGGNIAQLAFGNAWRALIAAEMLVGFGKDLGRSLSYAGETAVMIGVMTSILAIAIYDGLAEVHRQMAFADSSMCATTQTAAGCQRNFIT